MKQSRQDANVIGKDGSCHQGKKIAEMVKVFLRVEDDRILCKWIVLMLSARVEQK